MSTATKPVPPIRLRGRQPSASAPKPPPRPAVFDFTSAPSAVPTQPALPVPAPVSAPTPMPAGPARVQLSKRTRKTAINVTLPPWGTPFRIVEVDPSDRRGACTIIWAAVGCGTLRTPPAGFQPIPCADRSEAQELILILFRDWLHEAPRAGLLKRIRSELRGQVLGCRCGPRTACHGDVLLELANQVATDTPSVD